MLLSIAFIGMPNEPVMLCKLSVGCPRKSFTVGRSGVDFPVPKTFHNLGDYEIMNYDKLGQNWKTEEMIAHTKNESATSGTKEYTSANNIRY